MPTTDHERIAKLSAALPLRPDAEHVRCSLAAAFAYHAADLWPAGEPAATPSWIATHTDEILATLERLYAMATDDQPGAASSSTACWLPLLVDQPLDPPTRRLSGGCATTVNGPAQL
jgi:hypothetical protein